NSRRLVCRELLLAPGFQYPIFDQPGRTSAPRVVGAHAKSAVRIGDDGARPGVANLKSHGVFCAADPLHDADKRLLRAQLQGDEGVAAITLAKRMRLRCGRVYIADIDQMVAPGLREQLTNFVRDAR